MRKLIIISCILTISIVSCGPGNQKKTNGKINIVTTTTMITDMVSQLGGDMISVTGLMGAGVDPHLYKASEGDVNKLFKADLVIYCGLHLEGKLVEVFEKMEHQGKNMMAIADTLDPRYLISSENFASSYDPHIWFDMEIWKLASEFVKNKLIAINPENKNLYENNLKTYLSKLDASEMLLKNKVKELPEEKRVLVTAHDAFNYFGRAFGFQVFGLQGISTASEASVRDVQDLADFIVKNQVKAVFIESSVPKRNIEALQAAVNNKGFHVNLGGELFSDALGNPGTPEGTYTGMFEHNVNTIVNALK